MRTTLFFPTLIALGLTGGAALADKSHGAVERPRAHGDVMDKSYRAADKHAGAGPQRVAAPSRPAFDPGASRVRCSDTGQDCPQRSSGVAAVAARSGEAIPASRAPAFLDKVLGSDRTNINEAGEDQGMSGRAVKRAWSRATPGATGEATVPLAHQETHARAGEQASENRVSCNEGDVCTMSSKASKQQWAYASLKAGTWRAPEAKQPAAAARADAAPKGAQAVAAVRRQEPASRGDAPKADHDHD